MNDAELEGLRVVALTQAAAGPILGTLLSDLGADVIKVESRRKLDETRVYPLPSFGGGSRGPNQNVFNILSRGVKSCTLDLTRAQGLEVFKRLLKTSDVFITNFSPRALGKLGLDYAAMRAVKPEIIMVSISGFGSTGPERDYVAYAADADAIAGVTASFGHPGGEPRLGLAYAGDVGGTLYAIVGLMGALWHRRETGRGQFVDVALTEGMVTFAPEILLDYVMNGRLRPRMGNRDEIMAPHGCYPCRGEDRWVAIAVGTDQEWEALCRAMGNPAWTREDRFSDQFSRWSNQEDLDRLMGEWTSAYPHYQVAEMLQKVGVAAFPSLGIDELVHDPQITARGSLTEHAHPEGGTTGAMRCPWELTAPKVPAPLLGQHNDYVFKQLVGMSDEELAQLVDERVIY